MTEENAHLTLDEILEFLRPEDRERDGHSNQRFTHHLSGCAECAWAVGQYRGVMAELNPFKRGGKECPPSSIWAEVAAGVLPNDDALRHLEHVASCPSCSAQLKDALEIVGTNARPEPTLQQSLETSSPARQKSLAAEMAARSRQILESEARPAPKPLKMKPARTFRFPVWAFGAVAAVLILGTALAVFLRQGLGSTEHMLGQAYAQQRTVELRIPGAGYGPVRVERAQKQSHMSSPGALLEAEAAIKKGLEQHPEDPDLLRQKAEADLLNWDFQPAIETLGHALRIQPQSAKLLVDLATAYFERAEATDTPADYESALQHLGDALRLSPKDPTALFNRAIVHERLFLYSRAIADWEELLTIEGDAGWKQEAQKRLNEIRTKQQRHSSRDAPDHLTVAEFKSAVENKTTLDPEQYIQLAERKILPNISHPIQQDPNYQLAMLLAKHFESAHSDRFFADLMQSAGKPGFHEAVFNLGEASKANNAGHSEEAYSSAARSGELFQKLQSDAGAAASEFEEAYALHFESHADQCAKTAANVADTAEQRGYTWLEVQALLERAICSNLQGALGEAKELTQRALQLAKERNYEGFYLRGLMELATLESEAGDESSAWLTIQEGLDRYWRGTFSPVRGYSFYTFLDSVAERLGHWNVQLAAAREALAFSTENPNRIVQALLRSHLAQAALHLGETSLAEEQFQEAARLFSSVPKTPSAQTWELEARIDLANVRSFRSGNASGAFAALTAFLPDVTRISNRYIEFKYYTTLAQLKIKMGDQETAQKFLGTAIMVAEHGLQTLPTWRERLAWMDQKRQAYLLMVQSLLQSGQQDAALRLWERYLAANPDEFTAKTADIKTIALTKMDHQENTVVTYALPPDNIIIWMRQGRQVRSMVVPVPSGDLKRAAQNFLAECSRPDSNLALLRSNAHTLFSWLVKPVSQWLPAGGTLIIEPDGILSTLPMEALVDDSQAYLGEQYRITMASGLIAGTLSEPQRAIQPSDQALVVASPIHADGSFAPPPGALSEAHQVAAQFSHATMLAGNMATVSQVEKEIPRSRVFHFAGHATTGQTGSAILLADGTISISGAPRGHDKHLRTFELSHRWKDVSLAVLSACGTAKPSENLPLDSLVTGLLRAGVPHVVASRWNVDSVTTSNFMVRFYQLALSGKDVASAIQTAASGLRTSDQFSHPYYWAAFSAFGEA
ncbi:MAG TPA: CHAT domain-containing tetratricopeptide repeat protein [Candidatus Angelobacter sp.]|nr:CHAT domain-containing tetratricopeptide repeat protein [Candidatus Angelobacter sp.]